MTPSPSLLPRRSYRHPLRTVCCPLGALLGVLLSAGCATVVPEVESRLQGLQFHPNLYVVQVNDTIDSIAWRYRLSPRDLVALNPGLENGPKPGQRLNVVPGTQLADSVRRGGFRQATSPAQADRAGNSQNEAQWLAAQSPTQSPAERPAERVDVQQAPNGDAYVDGYSNDVYSQPAQTAPVIPQPPIEARRLESTQVDRRDAEQPAASAERQPPQQPAAQPQVMSEVRASARAPSDETLLGGEPLRAVESQAAAQPATQPADEQPKEEQLAMLSPDDGSWPREEIVPDDLDFAPVQGGSTSAAADEGFSGRWSWPTDGQIVRGFQPDRVGGQGVDIAGVPGQDVKAAMDGTVVYSGRDLSGEGNLIILRHPDNLLSTYSHARELYVAEDDVVRAGDSIASLGANDDEESVLGFEIRRDGNPLNPMNFLPVP